MSRCRLSRIGKRASSDAHKYPISNTSCRARGVNVVSVPVRGNFGRWRLQASGKIGNCVVKVSATSTLGFILTIFSKDPSNIGAEYKVF